MFEMSPLNYASNKDRLITSPYELESETIGVIMYCL